MHQARWFVVRLLLCLAVAAAASGCTWKHWERTRKLDTAPAYEGFLERHPDSRYSPEARRRLEELNGERDWRALSSSWDTLALETYRVRYPRSEHLSQIQVRVAEMRALAGCESADGTEPCDDFLRDYPDSRFRSRAREQVGQILAWRRVSGSDAIAEIEAFLRSNGGSRFAQRARARTDTLRARREWERVRRSGDMAAHEAFLTLWEGWDEAKEARSALESMRRDSADWAATRAAATPAAYQRFHRSHVGSPFISAAEGWLQGYANDRKGIDIVDALDQGKLEARTEGSGIRTVTLSVRRLTSYPLRVRIPAGSFFVAHTRAQNMVARSATSVWLADDDWTSLEVPAACANRSRAIPASRDSFDVQRGPHQEELRRLMAKLAPSGADFPVQQAAVWIITDDADYSALGILVERSLGQFFGGTRVIRESQAVRAMQLIEESGLGLQRRAIWRDRERLHASLSEGPLKRWLAQRMSQVVP